VFPDEFDAYIGMSMNKFNNEPTTYYIDCSSSALGTVWCTVDHWELWIMGSSDVVANTDISITVMNVRNPIAGTTSSFKVGHTDKDENYYAYNQTFGTVIPTALGSNIDIREVMRSDSSDTTTMEYKLFSSSIDYTFKFYTGVTHTINH
jgi:hypothetical protein